MTAPLRMVPGFSGSASDHIARTLAPVLSDALGRGVTPCGTTRAELTQFIDRELARWRDVVAGFRDTDA